MKIGLTLNTVQCLEKKYDGIFDDVNIGTLVPDPVIRTEDTPPCQVAKSIVFIHIRAVVTCFANFRQRFELAGQTQRHRHRRNQKSEIEIGLRLAHVEQIVYS